MERVSRTYPRGILGMSNSLLS